MLSTKSAPASSTVFGHSEISKPFNRFAQEEFSIPQNGMLPVFSLDGKPLNLTRQTFTPDLGMNSLQACEVFGVIHRARPSQC